MVKINIPDYPRLNIREHWEKDPLFQTSVFELDINHDFFLSFEDIAYLYGKTSAKKNYPNLFEAVRQENWDFFQKVLSQLEIDRYVTFTESVRNYIEQNYPEEVSLLEKPDLDPLSHYHGSIIAGILWALQEEFDLHSEYELQYCHRALSSMFSAPLYSMTEQLFSPRPSQIAGRHLWWPHQAAWFYGNWFDYHQFGSVQDNWAREEVSESEQNVTYTRLTWNWGWDVEARYLEDLFDLDIRTLKHELSNEELEMLDDTLTFLASIRPQDVQKIKALVFRDDPSLPMGGRTYAPLGRITLFNAFKSFPPSSKREDKDPFWARRYSEDYQLLLESGADVATHLRYVLAHELGHVVFPEVKQQYYQIVGLARDDLNVALNIIEYFAEDYSIFLTSGGQKVMRKNVAGETIPNDEERLKFFQRNFPLHPWRMPK